MNAYRLPPPWVRPPRRRPECWDSYEARLSDWTRRRAEAAEWGAEFRDPIPLPLPPPPRNVPE